MVLSDSFYTVMIAFACAIASGAIVGLIGFRRGQVLTKETVDRVVDAKIKDLRRTRTARQAR